MDDSLSIRNWGYYEPPPPVKTNLGNLALQLMSTVPTERDHKTLFAARSDAAAVMANGGHGGFPHRECGVPDQVHHMGFIRDSFIPHSRERTVQGFPGSANFPFLSEVSGSPNPQIPPPPDSSVKDEPHFNEAGAKGNEGPLKKRPNNRGACKAAVPRAKKSKKVPSEDGSNCSVPRTKPSKSTGVVINGVDIDISGIPIPVCSCTGSPQQCYRWGCGGWQSACCTTTVSMYPLPLSTKRRGARIAGRKMSQGAFKKVLEKLVSEGYNLSNPIDLRTHWAKHGTNKFVTIR